MELVIKEESTKTVDTRYVIKVLVRARGTVYVSGGQLVTNRSKATKYPTKDDALTVISETGRRSGLELRGIMMSAVPYVRTNGESGRR